MVDAGDGADDLPGALVLGHEVGERAGAVVAPHRLLVAEDHPVAAVDLVDGGHLGLRRHRAHEDPADQLGPRPVPVQVEPVGVGGVDEQLVGRQAHEHLRVARIDADVAPAGLLRPQRVDDAAAARRRSGRTPAGPSRGRGRRRTAMPRTWCSAGRRHDRLVIAGVARHRGAPAAPGDPRAGAHVSPRGSAARARAGRAARACCRRAG